MSDTASLPSNENLLNSVLSELKCRIDTPSPNATSSSTNSVTSSPAKFKKTSPPTPPPQNTKPILKNALKTEKPTEVEEEEQEKDINGIADYAVYCRSVGLPPDSLSASSNPSKPLTVASPKENRAFRPKPSIPPMKPVRKNKPVKSDGKAKPVFQRTIANGLQMSFQFRDILDSAFSSTAEKNEESPGNRTRTNTNPLHQDNFTFLRSRSHSHSNTFKKKEFNEYFKQSLESIDSGHEGSSKSTKPTDDIEDCFDVEGIYSIIDQTPTDSRSIDRIELMSTLSGHSDEGHHSHESGENERAEENKEGDEISLSSNGSGDELAQTKFIVKRIKARERARQLKKQATVHKERVGAFFDAAASNASDRIKKFRRPSLKFSHGKNKTLQNLANK